MKNTIKAGLIFFSLFIVSDAKAQWIKDSTSALPRNIKSTFMINQDIRFAVLDQTIYKTTDGGKTWVKTTLFVKGSFSNIWFQKIDFINNSIGFIQSQMDGISNLFTSKDTGKTWTSIPLKTKIKDCKILLISESKWLAFNNKFIEKTSDGGQTWQTFTTNNSDSVIYHIEVIENNEILVLSGNNDSIVNVNLSFDFGNQLEKIAELAQINDSIIRLGGYYSHHITKTTKGYIILSYYNCNCFNMIRDYSCLYFVSKENNNWKTVRSNFSFNFEQSQIYNLRDTLHITNFSTIYKLDNVSENWYPVHRLVPNTSGESFSGFHLINNTLYAFTTWGNFYKNANPNSSKNLSTITEILKPRTLVFPNPAADHLNFRLKDKDKGIITLSIYDRVGKQLFLKKYNNPEEIILNTDFLPSGNYSYTLLTGKGIEKAKFSIVK